MQGLIRDWRIQHIEMCKRDDVSVVRYVRFLVLSSSLVVYLGVRP